MTADEERARVVNARWPRANLPQPWHGYGLLGQIVFFVLTVAGIVAFYLVADNELVTAAVCIALAEYLIHARRWFGTGVESALWIGGLVSAITALPNNNAPEGNLLFAAAAAIAGYRVRNPVFGVAAACFVTLYFERVRDLGTVAAFVIAAVALLALYKTWRRPSTEWLFSLLVVVMPFAAEVHADRKWGMVTVAMSAAFAFFAFASAVWKRHHWMFAGAAAGASVAVGVFHQHADLKDEVTLATAGAVLLLAALAIARLLRGRTTGFVMTPAKLTELDDDLETLGTIVVAPAHSAGNPPEGRPQGGGGFGGAGATGDY